MIKDGDFVTKVKQEENYRFRVQFNSDKLGDIFMDEPEPLGKGRDPNAGRLLAAAVGNCMCASLVYCMQRSRGDMPYICADVYSTVIRNERGRFRIKSMTIKMFPVIRGERTKFNRCRDVFEDFCIVTQSVKEGIDVKVEVYPTHELPGSEGKQSREREESSQ